MKLRLVRGGPSIPAKKAEADGHKFDSLTERDYYLYRKLHELTDHIDVHPYATLGPGDRHCIDFLIIYLDGSVEFVDVKGPRKGEAARRARALKKRWSHPIPLRYVCRDGRKGWKTWE